MVRVSLCFVLVLSCLLCTSAFQTIRPVKISPLIRIRGGMDQTRVSGVLPQLTATATSSTSDSHLCLTPKKSRMSLMASEVSSSSSSLATAAAPSAAALAGLFTLWYGFNAGYNVFNAFVKRDFPLPWASATLQLLVGMFYIFPLWIFGIKSAPKLNTEDVLKLLPIGSV